MLQKLHIFDNRYDVTIATYSLPDLYLPKMKNEFLVSKETVVLRQWERSKQKFGFIKRVDKG